jgi:hypothetical protein
MTMTRLARSARLFIGPALAISLAALTPAILSAQMGGMGGMGGGGMVGGGSARGRSGGGMGGRGGPGVSGSMKSPAAMTRERIAQADPIEFLLDRKKPLELTKEQQESLKSLRKEMQRTQAPVFTELDKLFGDTPPRAGPPGGGMPGGGAPERALPDTVRTVIAKLSDIQDSFLDRAREQLTHTQRTRADSLQQVMLAEERATFEKEREKRQRRR